MNEFDVVIIGAGFAGLSAADRLGQSNFKTLLIDKKKSLDKHIHTTGIIVHEALKEWDISEELLKPVTDVCLISPQFDESRISSETYNFYLTATGKVLEEKLNKIKAHKNLEVLLNTQVTKVSKIQTGFLLDDLGVKTKYLIIANGAKTKLAKALGFKNKNKYLAGHEFEYSLKDTNLKNEMAVFIHPKICKGYIGWVVPGVESVQVGLAVNNGEKLSISDFLDYIKPKYPFKNLKPIGQRSGLIPVGGTCKKVYKEGALAIGDTAGYVSPLTAGGIHTAMRYGFLGAELIENLLKTELSETKKRTKLIREHQNRLPNFYKKHLLKKLFDTFNKNIIWYFLFKTNLISVFGKIAFYLRKSLK